MNSDDIYENLPCHTDEALRNGNGTSTTGNRVSSVMMEGGGGGGVAGGRNRPTAEGDEHGEGKVQNNLALNSKDMLYATPLKKSERPVKVLNNAPAMQNGNGVGGGGRQNTATANAGTFSGEAERDTKIINAELEDRRIRDFLKDTSQMHKKIELHKTYQSSNFSYLARKEHFADLVQRNVNSSNGAAADHHPEPAGDGADAAGDEPDSSAALAVAAAGGYKTLAGEEEDKNLDLDINESLNELEARCNEKLEMLAKLNRTRSSTATEQRSQEDNEQQADLLGAQLMVGGDEGDAGVVPKPSAPPLSALTTERGSKAGGGSNNLTDPNAGGAGSGEAIISAHLNREWVLKKIAMCLEQRISKKPVPPVPTVGAGVTQSTEGAPTPSASSVPPAGPGGYFARSGQAAAASGVPPTDGGGHHRGGENGLPSLGYLVLGSNGSGKTSICNDIIEGTSGTKGMLNRRLLACYFVNSQNPECHSLSMFIRSVILQILSHSSYVNSTGSCGVGPPELINLSEVSVEANELQPVNTSNDCLPEADQQQLKAEPVLPQPAGESHGSNQPATMDATDGSNEAVDKELEDAIRTEMKINERVAEFCSNRKKVSRQQSEPVESLSRDREQPNYPYKTHPPAVAKAGTGNAGAEESNDDEKLDKATMSPGRPAKVSKIPIAIGSTIRSPKKMSPTKEDGSGKQEQLEHHPGTKPTPEEEEQDDTILEGGGEAIAEGDMSDIKLVEDEEEDAVVKSDVSEKAKQSEPMVTPEQPAARNDSEEKKQHTMRTTKPMETSIPPPLPKSKNCRQVIADGYYEMLLSNPDIFESLTVDSIEKNPDDCFKKAILFPLLELCPPKNALLLLIDSIDENYIQDGNLISTLKGKQVTKSRNIAELLSNHIHLMPKWLFMVCTAKKQNKNITKLFTGFKKLTLDDLRKSHVVKDVQQYIINRLNTDFRGINLTKDIIESLNQLYIKSNGCLLYLYKVLNGIRENFFTFREIKLIPCTLNGLYLYICQKSFNKKQYSKIRPILNVLLVCNSYVDKYFIYNCLRTHNYTLEMEDFERRLELMRNIVEYSPLNPCAVRIFHNSFCDWLIDVKFSTKKFLCDLNEGHVMVSMYYTVVADEICPNKLRLYLYHLIKTGEYLTSKNVDLDLLLILLETKSNLSDCFYTNLLNCCAMCEDECRNDINLSARTKYMLDRFLNGQLGDDFMIFLNDFFKPNLPTDCKVLKLLIETGINNADTALSCESSAINSPVLSDRSQNIDSELAELLISSEKSCQQELQKSINLELLDCTGAVGGGGGCGGMLDGALLARDGGAGRVSAELARHRYSAGPSITSGGVGGGDGGSSALGDSKSDIQNDRVGSGVQCDMFEGEMHKGKALIHILANEGNHTLLERALNACKDPIDLEIEDLNGQTALNIAARNGHQEIVKLLLTYKQPLRDGTGRYRMIDVNHADRDGWTPLRSASWGGHTEVVKLLIETGVCAIDRADKEGRTALRAAAWSGNEDIVKILIEAGANVNSIDKQGRTSLIAASYMGHYDIVEILLENGADVNHTDLDGRNALCVAALCGSSGYSRVISTLLEYGANTDQTDNEGMSPLLVSSFEGNAEICELLLENGADPDMADNMGRTPLWAACTSGHANVVKLLLFWGCGIDCMDSEGRTVLSVAAAQGNLETVRQLLDRGLDETHRDNAGWTPLHYAAFEGYADICVQLLESGAKIDECDNEGKAALHLAAQEGHNAVMEAILNIHRPCIDQRAHDGKTAFRLACLEEHFECIQTLLKFGCDINSKDADSRTTLYILALENKLKAVKFLLEYSNADVNIPDSEGRTALHVSAWQGHAEMVKLLITLGNADVNAMDLESRTPLHSCAWQGNHEVMQLLLYYGAVPDHACKQGATALGISAQEGHEKCVSYLLKYGANPYKSDHCGRTPIKLAAKSNRNNVLRILENFTKNDLDCGKMMHPHLNLKSPDELPPCSSIHNPSPSSGYPNNPNLLMPASGGGGPAMLNVSSTNSNTTSSTTQNNNFYENTMHSDTSSLQKRKSVISSQSTGSSNEQAPMSFTQQLQKHSRHHNSKSHHIVQQQHQPHHQQQTSSSSVAKFSNKKHSQVLPNVEEYQANIASNIRINPNDADLFDLGCMSPLYATPPHSPSSEISSPGQNQPPSSLALLGKQFEEMNISLSNNSTIMNPHDNHFARDTHMRIILGNNQKESGQLQGASGGAGGGGKSSKRSGIATNPAMRLIRNRIDSAAQLIRRTNNMLSSSGNNQGSSSIGVKSGTFQWRKESQM
ncbi:ankyrin repeat domain-containing protein 50 [Anopheles gambiae]|uniref:ankyrin repeat domain-containing protein 50 n=1 Tax=Anopheles gambiae TaxID=7165 RepID=UPI002AC9C241|nr:ankyrin repeat domain-containing protein 50 [Anopheles gambiae]XP_313120.6 ankyrin repeat domain-containing protein 50 [Anopheles gambiae]